MVHTSELMRNCKNLEHASKVIKHESFNIEHKKAIQLRFSAHEHQVKHGLYCTYLHSCMHACIHAYIHTLEINEKLKI